MASQGYKRLLPFQQRDENDTVNLYSLTNTGERGMLVTVDSANMDEKHGWDYNHAPGASYNGVSSFRYETKTKVKPAASGDTKYSILGLTLFDVAETDENGEKYIYNKQKARENSTVVSGESVPVGTKGIFTLNSLSWSNGTGNLPQVGDVAVAAADGKFYFADYSTEITSSGVPYGEQHIVGKVIGTGSKQDGYVMLKLDI